MTHEECLDYTKGHCEGEVRYRTPLSGTGRAFPRCERHWDERLDLQESLNARYPDSPIAPSGFDPYYAGETWSDAYAVLEC